MYRGAVARADADLAHLDLHGTHDLRHTFSTWLEDAGIPARVIDELMGHEPSRGGDLGGSRIGARYRHTTPETATRVVGAVEARLTVVLRIAANSINDHPNRVALRCSNARGPSSLARDERRGAPCL
jgi:hypothetical protein